LSPAGEVILPDYLSVLSCGVQANHAAFSYTTQRSTAGIGADWYRICSHTNISALGGTHPEYPWVRSTGTRTRRSGGTAVARAASRRIRSAWQ